MKRTFTRRNTAVGAIALAVGLVIGTAGGGFAGGGMPADKTSIAGSNAEDLDPGQEKVILATRMKVSTPADLILGVTAECTILTRLTTNNDTPSASQFGNVEIRVTVDGREVPIQTAGAGNGPDGRVNFCNRTYKRTVTDQEDPEDGIDQTDDYIQSKTANAFNWVAFNVGVPLTSGGYDNPANNTGGGNIIDVRVFAKYTRTNTPNTCVSAEGPVSCSEAYVGKRTLVIEPVHAAVNEESSPIDPAVTL